MTTVVSNLYLEVYHIDYNNTGNEINMIYSYRHKKIFWNF